MEVKILDPWCLHVTWMWSGESRKLQTSKLSYHLSSSCILVAYVRVSCFSCFCSPSPPCSFIAFLLHFTHLINDLLTNYVCFKYICSYLEQAWSFHSDGLQTKRKPTLNCSVGLEPGGTISSLKGHCLMTLCPSDLRVDFLGTWLVPPFLMRRSCRTKYTVVGQFRKIFMTRFKEVPRKMVVA